MKKIFITGGHYTPAKAVIDELQKQGGWEIFYLGRKYAMEDSSATALEYQEISKISGITYLVVTTGRLQRRFFVNIGQSIRALSKIFIGFPQTLIYLLKYRPGLILSFGGYVALPVTINAWLLGIPVITHEQTVVSGLSNEIISALADKILISWKSSQDKFPKDKVVLTGNLLREEILSQKISKRTHLKKILVTGGNLGSHALNVAVNEVAGELTKKYQILHQTGQQDNLKSAKNYVVKKNLSGLEMAKALAQADLVISRSGANTTAEIAYCAVPAILVPIPWVVHNEQKKNAQILVDSGMAQIIQQDKLNRESLLATISDFEKSYSRHAAKAFEARKIIVPDSAKKVVDEIEKIV